ncbi:uncharacterized protein LOC135357514 [Latimeria chalumnae]|uniref:uncharacterized protein LOC135357514 n=1 Tax=Latimeria chalumnae TaxID=7897 RepID=UPI00313B3E96
MVAAMGAQGALGRGELRQPIFMPEAYSGEGQEWGDWLEQFEMAAEINGWDEATRLKFIGLLLRGKAREVYRSLTLEVKQEYSSLKLVLQQSLEPATCADWNRIAFFNKRRSKGESIWDFGCALRWLANKAFPETDSTTRDVLARDQFITHVGGGEFRIQFQINKPPGPEEAIKQAAELELVHELESLDIQSSKIRVHEAGLRKKSPATSTRDPALQEMMEAIGELRSELAQLKEAMRSRAVEAPNWKKVLWWEEEPGRPPGPRRRPLPN